MHGVEESLMQGVEESLMQGVQASCPGALTGEPLGMLIMKNLKW